MSQIIIMHPTFQKATQNWLQICRKYEPLIRKAKRNHLSVEFINGDVWYFRGEIEGRRVCMGYHTNVVNIDDFPLDEKIGEAFVKE